MHYFQYLNIILRFCFTIFVNALREMGIYFSIDSILNNKIHIICNIKRKKTYLNDSD